MQSDFSYTLHQTYPSKLPRGRSATPNILVLLVYISVGLTCASVAEAGDIHPRDGHWLAVMKFQSVSGCSAQMRQEIEAEAKDEELYSKVLTFPEPFDLNRLNDAWDVNVKWTRRGPNHWVGRMTETERTLFGKIISVTDLNSLIISDGLIDQQVVTTVTFPPRLARKLGADEPCVINSDITHRLR